MSRVDEILKGLNEAIEYENGNLKASRVVRLSIVPVSDFMPQEIKEIRNSTGMSQTYFAMCMGVTKKAIEAWEGGRSTPDGAARRTLGLVKNNPDFFKDNQVSICDAEDGVLGIKKSIIRDIEKLEKSYGCGVKPDFTELKKKILDL